MSKPSPATQTPIRAPRPGPGVPEHPAPRQGSLPPTIGLPPKVPRVFQIPSK